MGFPNLSFTISITHGRHPWDWYVYESLHDLPSKSTIHVGKYTKLVPWMVWESNFFILKAKAISTPGDDPVLP